MHNLTLQHIRGMVINGSHGFGVTVCIKHQCSTFSILLYIVLLCTVLLCHVLIYVQLVVVVECRVLYVHTLVDKPLLVG